MNKTFIKIITALIFIFTALGISAMVFYPPPWNARKDSVEIKPRIVIPRELLSEPDALDSQAELMAREDNLSPWIPLSDGEAVVSVLTGYFDGGFVEKQFAAYRNLTEIDSPIYLTYIDYDEENRVYERVWNAKTAATRPGTISLYTRDLIGDRSVCVLLHGMNGEGQYTLTIFRKNPSTEAFAHEEEPFTKIAELRIDGTINVRELERSQSYQNGQGQGQSFTILAYSRDLASSNILDQEELVYAYDAGKGVFAELSRTKIPGALIEQRRVRELLGSYRAFEEFVSGLWYHVTPQGVINKEQYIFFSPEDREIIFYGDDTQQVFHWLVSNSTRYGIYVSSQNISVTTLRRSIDIELESLEGIRVRVNEDVRLKIGVNTPWDGSYRKAGPLDRIQKPAAVDAHIDAWYDGSLGKIHFSPDGYYELNSGGVIRQGNYAFFRLGDQELVELRSNELRSNELRSNELRSSELRLNENRSDSALGSREIYLIESQTAEAESYPRTTMNLLRVRIGVKGVTPLNERAIALTLVTE